MVPEAFIYNVNNALSLVADSSKATQMKAYQRGQFDFFGVPAPQRRMATRSLLQLDCSAEQLMELVHELWAQPQREYQYVAIDLLSRHWKRFSLEHIDELLLLVTQRSWWDSVDGLAGVIGDILRAACKHSKNAQNKMDVALLSEDFWVRRVAMLHQLGWRAETDVARLFDYARKLSPDKNFFIRKAIGWSLRDYARHEPNQVLRFLNEAGTRISPLSKREATKHLQAT